MNVSLVKIRFCCILFLTTTVSSCATSPNSPSPWIEVDSVLANPTAFDGKKVTVKGWVSIRNEDRGIWDGPADYANRNRRRCISLLNTYSDESINRALDRKYVLVTGVVDADSYHDASGQGIVRLASCNRVAIRFEEPNGLRLLTQ